MSERLTARIDLYPVLEPLVHAWYAHRYDITVEGKDAIPTDEPVLITANHLRLEDSFLIASAYTDAVGRTLRFGAKKEYFDGLGLAKPGEDKGRFGRSVRFAMEHTRMIPIDRKPEDKRAAFHDLERQVADRLRHGDSVALHPEGTRSLDGLLYKFQYGAARLALQNEVSLLPVGVTYKDETGQKPQARIMFGEPILATQFDDYPLRARERHLSQELEQRVATLTGQTRANTLAAIRRQIHPDAEQ